MTRDVFAHDGADGATPLTEEEKNGLKLRHIALRRERDEAEAVNIASAKLWLQNASRRTVASEAFLRRLHKEMFGQIWKWAGCYSKECGRAIGVDFHLIPVKLRELLGDIHYWMEHATYPADEIAIRFHHRLVQIHPFPNGNGRHARLAADLLARQLGRPAFSWGGNPGAAGAAREKYMAALRHADRHDIGPLLAFARL